MFEDNEVEPQNSGNESDEAPKKIPKGPKPKLRTQADRPTETVKTRKENSDANSSNE